MNLKEMQKAAQDDYWQFVHSMSKDIAKDKINELLTSPSIRLETQQRMMAIAVWALDRGGEHAVAASNELVKLVSMMGVESMFGEGGKLVLPTRQPQKPFK